MSLAQRCNQCWLPKPLTDFIGARGNVITWCTQCREKYRGGGYGERGSEPRRHLRVVAPEPRFLWAERSGNKKLGGIPACIVSAETCPPSCGFYGRGCFAEFGMLGHHWRRAQAVGISWAELLERIRALPKGTVWRYAVAGDLPGVGDELDVPMLHQLIDANSGRRGFTFTHKPLRSALDRLAVRVANGMGFTINLSADSLDHARHRRKQKCGPVALVLPRDRAVPGGVVVCPAERGELTCRTCQICTLPERRGSVGFHAHGQMHATVSRIASENNTGETS